MPRSLYDIAIDNRLTIDEYIIECIQLILYCYYSVSYDIPVICSTVLSDNIAIYKLYKFMHHSYNQLISSPDLSYVKLRQVYIESPLCTEMPFEAAFICILAKRMVIKNSVCAISNIDNSKNYPVDCSSFIIKFSKFEKEFNTLKNRFPDDIMLLWKYYWILYAALPYLTNFGNTCTGHTLKLIPRLAEGKNIEYSFGGKGTFAMTFRSHMWAILKDEFSIDDQISYKYSFIVTQLLDMLKKLRNKKLEPNTFKYDNELRCLCSINGTSEYYSIQAAADCIKINLQNKARVDHYVLHKITEYLDYLKECDSALKITTSYINYNPKCVIFTISLTPKKYILF